ncbi:MAG: Crp/Fnr family transcriptional regulator [Dehalococcoidia bacterium]|nr:Crp/Fnr family transcriptional regulator [Dehalococcoidia bacterium]
MEDAAFLVRVPLFASLKPALLDELAGKLAPKSYRRGEVIFHQDDPGSAMHLIKSGQVKIATTSAEGEEVIMALLKDGDFFGELSLLDDKPRSANAVAMEATQTLILRRDDFADMLSKHHEMVGGVLVSLAERLRRTDQLLEDAVFLDLPARLSKRLLELAQKHGIKTAKGLEIDLRLTQQDLAAALGVTRVALNKHLGRLQDEELISLESKRIIITRPEELRKRVY